MKMRSFQVCQCGAPLQMNEAETPKPQGTEVLLKMLAAGVCHSDLHIWDGYYEIGGGKKLMLADRGIKLPLTMGHENVGEVVAVGPDAKGVKVGDVRLVNPWMGCGDLQGLPARRREPLPQAAERRRLLARRLCDAHAGAAAAPPVRHRRPDARAGRAARLLRRHRLQRAEEGRATLQRRAGRHHRRRRRRPDGRDARARRWARRTSSSSTSMPAKREAALKAGATKAVDGSAADAVAQIQAATGGGAWAVIDFVGSGATVKLAVDSIIKGGTVVVVGLFGGDVTVPTPYLPLRAMTLHGSYVGSQTDMAELLDLVKRTGMPPVPIRTRPLEEVNDDAERPARRQDRRPRGADAGGVASRMARRLHGRPLACVGERITRPHARRTQTGELHGRHRTARDAGADQGPLQGRSRRRDDHAARPRARSTTRTSPARSRPGARSRSPGLHPATGGSGLELCSGDMLLEALVACAGVTLKAVSTALDIPLKSGNVSAEGDLDFRGTLGVAKDAPVGFAQIRLTFDVDTDAPQEKLDQLLEAHRALLRGVSDHQERPAGRGEAAGRALAPHAGASERHVAGCTDARRAERP